MKSALRRYVVEIAVGDGDQLQAGTAARQQPFAHRAERRPARSARPPPRTSRSRRSGRTGPSRRDSPAAGSRPARARPSRNTRARACSACARETVIDGHLGAEFLGGGDREPAPAAADLQQPLSGADRDLLRQGAVFGPLRRLQILGAVARTGRTSRSWSGRAKRRRTRCRDRSGRGCCAGCRARVFAPQQMLDAPQPAVPDPAEIAVAPGVLVAAQQRQQGRRGRAYPSRPRCSLRRSRRRHRSGSGARRGRCAAGLPRAGPARGPRNGRVRTVRQLDLEAAAMEVRGQTQRPEPDPARRHTCRLGRQQRQFDIVDGTVLGFRSLLHLVPPASAAAGAAAPGQKAARPSATAAGPRHGCQRKP